MVRLYQRAPLAGVEDAGFSPVEMNDFRQRSHTFADVVEYHSMSFTFFGQGDPQRVVTGVVSANFFDVMGVKPVLGRLFLPGEDQIGAEPVLLLTYSYWKEVMGGDPNVVGKTFQMNDRMHTVVGVLPPLPNYPDTNLIYMPVSSCPFRSAPHMQEDRDMRMLAAFARLKPGVTFEQAEADAGAVATQLAAEYPTHYPPGQGYRADAVPLSAELTSGARPTLLGPRVAAHLRQRGQPHAFAAGSAGARTGHSFDAGRVEGARLPAVADREHLARRGRRGTGPAGGLRVHELAHRLRRAVHAAHRRHRD
jgi:hypothetical protein